MSDTPNLPSRHDMLYKYWEPHHNFDWPEDVQVVMAAWADGFLKTDLEWHEALRGRPDLLTRAEAAVDAGVRRLVLGSVDWATIPVEEADDE